MSTFAISLKLKKFEKFKKIQEIGASTPLDLRRCRSGDLLAGARVDLCQDATNCSSRGLAEGVHPSDGWPRWDDRFIRRHQETNETPVQVLRARIVTCRPIGNSFFLGGNFIFSYFFFFWVKKRNLSLTGLRHQGQSPAVDQVARQQRDIVSSIETRKKNFSTKCSGSTRLFCVLRWHQESGTGPWAGEGPVGGAYRHVIDLGWSMDGWSTADRWPYLTGRGKSWKTFLNTKIKFKNKMQLNSKIKYKI